MTLSSERREYKRQALDGSAIALLGTSPGSICDISMGGLSFVYRDTELPRPESDSVDILDGQWNFFLENIFCRTISEHSMVSESQYISAKKIRRSLEFVGISDFQKNQIETYLNAYRAGSA